MTTESHCNDPEKSLCKHGAKYVKGDLMTCVETFLRLIAKSEIPMGIKAIRDIEERQLQRSEMGLLEDVRYLLKAFRLMRQMCIEHDEYENPEGEEAIDKQFEERMKGSME
jgi:hypothetical protein